MCCHGRHGLCSLARGNEVINIGIGVLEACAIVGEQQVMGHGVDGSFFVFQHIDKKARFFGLVSLVAGFQWGVVVECWCACL